jgi:putative sterol carrier protein
MPITVADVFNEIPKRFNSSAAGDWTASIEFQFQGGEGGECTWLVSVADGACTVGEGSSDSPSATVKTSTDTWIGMVTGTVNPMQAFMTGDLVVEGNIADVMKLQDKSIFPREA